MAGEYRAGWAEWGEINIEGTHDGGAGDVVQPQRKLYRPNCYHCEREAENVANIYHS
jgi:hypothetical protein